MTAASIVKRTLRLNWVVLMKERIQKVLANLGVDSRRKVEEMVLQGRISVNGEVRSKLPILVDVETDRIEVDGERIKSRSKENKKVYLLMNKPKGVYCTNVSQGVQLRAIDLLPDHCFSHALVHLGFVREQAVSSAAWRARPFWSILSDAGIRVGIVRWPLTYPAQTVQGFVVSDRFHELLGSMFEFDERVAYPSDALPVARAAFTDGPETPAAAPPTSDDRDRFYSKAMRDLRGGNDILDLSRLQMKKAALAAVAPGRIRRRLVNYCWHTQIIRTWQV